MGTTAARSLLFAALLPLLCTAAPGQEKKQTQGPTNQQQSAAVLKVTTRLVTVDVVARDRKGNPVRDLKASDFQITEQAGSHKSAQEVASFRLLDRQLATAPDSDRAALQLPAGAYTNLVSTNNLSAPPTILLVDGLNTDAITQVQVRQKMVRLLASAPGDVPVAVFLLGRKLRLLQNFTTEAKLLKAAAQQSLALEGTNPQVKDSRDDPLSHSSLLETMADAEGQSDAPGGAPSLTKGGNSNTLLAMRALELQRFEREQYAESMDMRVKLTLDALRMIARHLSGYPGRKNLIWLSSTFPLSIMPDANLTMEAKLSGIRNYSTELTAVASALTDAQIAVYPVDPRGMDTQELFDPASRGKRNPFSEGATLSRESNLRSFTQLSMQELAEQTGGKVCLNNNDLSECVKRAIEDSSSYYELTYYPTNKNWHGEFRRISVKTTRPGVQLSSREGYFARDSEAAISAKGVKDKDVDTRLSEVACNDFLTATSILVQASALPSDQPGHARYLLVIDSNALTFGSQEGGMRNLEIELATCMFSERGLPLQYNRQTLEQKFTETDFVKLRTQGLAHTISLVPKPETARVRLLVCDTRTGILGSVDVPYPGQIISSAPAKSGKNDGEAAKAATQTLPPSLDSSHTIRFHDKEGRTGVLQWDAEKIGYGGDLPAETSARAMFESLWGKSFSCQSGRLLSISDKTISAPQPLHFRGDDLHMTEVYLDTQNGVQYSGNMTVDSSVRPVFEALRTLYQCKNSETSAAPH